VKNLAIASLLALLIVACNKGKESESRAGDSAAGNAKESSSAAARPPEEPPRAEPEPVASAPRDLDVAVLSRELGCGKKTSSEACRILDEFGRAAQWSLDTPSGEARWAGNIYIRNKGAEERQPLIAWAKQFPTAEVGPGYLPLKFGTGSFPEELAVPSQKLVGSLSRGDPPPRRNHATPFVESFTPEKQRRAVKTNGTSVAAIAEDAAYLRRPNRRKLLLIQPSTERKAAHGDGSYAEMWLMDW
jgi:hypothetical protein